MMQLHGGITCESVDTHALHPYDFSANINPWGCSPKVAEALALVKPHYYPDPDCTRLRAAIAAHEGVDPSEVLCGNGAVELIWAVCQWAASELVSTMPSICVAEPTFSQYAVAAERCGLAVHRYRACEETKFHLDDDAYAALVAECRPHLTFVCSPNNPTGQTFDQPFIDRLVNANPTGYVMVDQAYREYADAPSIAHSDRVVRISSMTKAYGLAGLRLGYAVGNAAILQAVSRQMPPWTVNAVAQAAGVAALGDQPWLRETMSRRRQSADVLRSLLTTTDFDVVCEGAGFFLIRVGRPGIRVGATRRPTRAGRGTHDGHFDANASRCGVPCPPSPKPQSGTWWRERLFDRGFAVRDCTSFGLPDFIRISAGSEDACRDLVAAMVEVRAEVC